MEQREPPWLTAKVDQRITLMGAELGQQGRARLREFGFTMTTLTEPAVDATDEERQRWERTCDNCGKFCSGDDFFTGTVTRIMWGVQIIMTFGCCADCAGLART